MPTQHTAGDIVWAKLKGYPFWPSRVENDKELSDEVLRSKPPGRSQSVPVLFLGTFDYGWIAPDNLRSFQEHLAQYSKLPKRDKHFEQAIQQALDPDQIEVVLEERRRAADAAEDDEEEEEDEEARTTIITK
ncbi:hypothetical protein BDF22DRAFT_77721 [Syncephalis plumigaleata]|nr:hypothetical protein BDF22DRAFT_77721 [Syncephalis plumigaleata]